MIRSLYTAASAMFFGMRQQEIAADNLANTRTPGYKGSTSAGEAFSGVLARRVGGAQAPIPVNTEEVLGRIGTGVYQSVRGNDFSEGALRNTDGPLDFAVGGNGFFMVQTPDGVEYTRDGHFHRNLQDQLVNAQGLTVLGADGNPIILDTDRVRVKSTGEIYRGEELVGTLQVRDFGAKEAVRVGGSRFKLLAGVVAAPVALGSEVNIAQGMLEEANVNAARIASGVLSTARAFEASQKIFTTIDETLAPAVLQIGKVN